MKKPVLYKPFPTHNFDIHNRIKDVCRIRVDKATSEAAVNHRTVIIPEYGSIEINDVELSSTVSMITRQSVEPLRLAVYRPLSFVVENLQ
jgi:hypothetical protein